MGHRPAKLNLFALPSQTSLLFFIIAVVVGLPLLLSSGSGSFLLLPILPMGVALLTLWDFLRQPDVEQRRWQMRPLPEEQRWLSEWVSRLAREAGLKQVPILLIAGNSLDSPFAFGAWRRHFLAFPDWLIREMELALRRTHTDDATAIEAILRHELGHFVNRDVWLTLLSRSLLKMTVVFLLVNWFAMLWTPFLYMGLRTTFADFIAVVPGFLLQSFPQEMADFLYDPPPMNAVDSLVYITMVSGAMIPLLVGCFILRRHTWNQLLKVREFYCDARVATWLRSARPIGQAMSWFAGAQLQRPVTGQTPIRHRLPDWLGGRPNPQPLAWPDTMMWQRWFSPQPQATARYRAMANPESIYGDSRQVGLLAGIAVLLLYLVLASTFAPGGRGVNLAPVAGFGFVVMALALLPSSIVQGNNRSSIRRAVLRAVGFFSLIFGGSMAVMLLIASIVIIVMPEFLDLTMYAIAMVMPGGVVTAVIDDPMAWLVTGISGSVITFLIGLPGLLILFLWADQAIRRRVLTWYGAAFLARHPQRIMLLVTILLTALLWLGAVPVLNLLAFPTFFEMDLAFWLQISLAVIMATTGGVAFWRLHRRHARRCPACETDVAGDFWPGKQCACGALLNGWSVAHY